MALERPRWARLRGRGARRRDRRPVVVLVRSTSRWSLTSTVETLRLAPARPMIVTVSSTRDAVAAINRLPRVDGVVDLRSGRPREQLRLLRRSLFGVGDGGTWTLVGPQAARVDRLLRGRGGAGGARRSTRELRLAVSTVDRASGRVVVRKSGEHWLKTPRLLSEEHLCSREPGLTVREWRGSGGGRIERSRPWRSHGVDDAILDARLAHPALRVRHYRGPVFLGRGAVARGERTVLPESFRWDRSTSPTNSRLVDANDEWARPRRPESFDRHLDGPHYYLDYDNPGHYGHFVTESLSKIWAWDEARAAAPDLKLLLRRSPLHAQRVAARPEAVYLTAYGIAPEDVVWVEGGVTVGELIGATPMWHNHPPFSVHPGIREVWHRVRAGLAPAGVETHEKLFVTRHGGNRPCRNAAAVNDFFAAHGFHVTSPGQLSIPEQAELFAGARVIAGFGGTGMFNAMFASRLEHMIVLNHTSYDARNELLYAAAHDCAVDLFWGDPDVHHPVGRRSAAAFQSAWAFDLERHRAALDAVLR